MSLKCNDWKVWKLFVVATVTAAIAASISSAESAEAKAVTEHTIEERLARIREQVKQNQDQQLKHQSDLSPIQNKTIQAQWPWNDWFNWADGPWNNGPWSDWNNGPWSDWSDRPWSNWSDWSDRWSNYW